MRFIPFYIFLIAVFISPLTLGAQQLDYVPGQVIVQFDQKINSAQRASTIAAKYNNKYQVNKVLFQGLGIYLLEFDPNLHALDNVLAELIRDRDVLYVQSNNLVEQRTTEPDDPYFNEQWYLETIQAAEAWDITTGGKDINGREIVIAVMDRGFDIDHEDLAPNLWVNEDEIPDDGIDNDNNNFVDDYYGWNFELNSDTPGNSIGTTRHGTNVAGIAAARGDNDTGISGAVWDVKILFMSGLRNAAQIINAYAYIEQTRRRYNETNGQEGAYIVATTISLGITGAFAADNEAWCGVYDEVGQQGVLNVCATDNLDADVDIEGDMPSTCTSEFLISVTNTDQNNRKTSPAAYGSRSIDIGAPGVENVTTDPNDNYVEVTGTSVSAPLVGGAIALLYSAPCQTLADQALVNPADLALNMRNIVFGGVEKNASLEGLVSQAGVLNILGSMEVLNVTCGGGGLDQSTINLQKNPVQLATEDIIVNYSAPVDGEIFIRIFDLKGAMVYESEVDRSFFGNNRLLISTANNLTTGIYFISLSLPGNESVTEKLLVY